VRGSVGQPERLYPPRPAAPWRVTAVAVVGDRRLAVTFHDGVSGEIDLRRFLAGAAVDGTVFAALRDPVEFSRVRIELGTLTWPSGADLAPDAMHEMIRRSGVWIVEE
jgi:hypothetical protein